MPSSPRPIKYLYILYIVSSYTRVCGCLFIFEQTETTADRMTCPNDVTAGNPAISRDIMQGLNNMSLNEYDEFLHKENMCAVPRAPGERVTVEDVERVRVCGVNLTNGANILLIPYDIACRCML